MKELIPHWFKSLRTGCSEQHIPMSAVIVGLNHVTSHLNTDTEVLREMV